MPGTTRTTDGITRAERRILGRAGIDVVLTHPQFKQPGVQPTTNVPPVSNRHIHIAKKVDIMASKLKSVSFAQGTDDPSVTERINTKMNVDPGYIPSDDDDDDDNTDSYNKVRKIIFGQAIRYNVTKLEQKYVNFTDIVDINDYEALENHVSEDLAARFGEGDMFRLIMLLVIIANSVIIGIQTSEDLSTSQIYMFTILDYSFLSLFILEIVFKWYYGFFEFWKNSWNVFDLAIVGMSLAGPAGVPLLSDARILRIIRVVRAFRSLRSITILNGLQIVVQTIFDSIPDMINVIILLLIVMFIWAVTGVTLFGTALPEYFGDLQTTMFTLFIMITQIGWVESFHKLEAQGQFVAAAIYYASFMIVGVFIFMKIIVAVVVSNLEEAYQAEKKKLKKKYRALKTSMSSTQGLKKFQRPIRNMPPGDDPIWKGQIPYEIPDFDKIPKAKVENYFLILTIMEQNLKEYMKLKEELQDILVELRLVNTPIMTMIDDDYEDFDESMSFNNEGEGDALSRWIRTNK